MLSVPRGTCGAWLRAEGTTPPCLLAPLCYLVGAPAFSAHHGEPSFRDWDLGNGFMATDEFLQTSPALVLWFNPADSSASCSHLLTAQQWDRGEKQKGKTHGLRQLKEAEKEGKIIIILKIKTYKTSDAVHLLTSR